MHLKLNLSLLLLMTGLSAGWGFLLATKSNSKGNGRPSIAHGYKPSSSPTWKTLKETKGDKIIGGTEVTPNSLPYLVLVFRDYEPWCGGSILDSTHVLSAAHCFVDKNVSLYEIFTGEHNFSDWTGNEQVRNVAKITLHPKYDDDLYPNDVAVITLASPLTFDNAVKAVDLNAEDACPKPGDMCTVAGWGVTQSGYGSTVPLKVDVPVQPDAKCTAVYSGYAKDQLCAGKEGTDSCQGDSGGPLVCQCGGSVKQVGVVSYGQGCALADYPGVYARVSYFLPWIKQTAGMK